MLLCLSSLTMELLTSLRPRCFNDACGRLAWEELLVFFEVVISILFEFGAGAVIVGLVGYNSTYLLRSLYLTWLFNFGLFYTQLYVCIFIHY